MVFSIIEVLNTPVHTDRGRRVVDGDFFSDVRNKHCFHIVYSAAGLHVKTAKMEYYFFVIVYVHAKLCNVRANRLKKPIDEMVFYPSTVERYNNYNIVHRVKNSDRIGSIGMCGYP